MQISSPKETRVIMVLAGVMALRMLGIFMVMSLLTLYTHRLPGATASVVGLPFALYALMQALLQMPFGLLSDRYGRKKMITIGFIFFIAGSIGCAFAHTFNQFLIGRILQGMGATGSVILALTADCTHEASRTKAMAILGMTIGLAFVISIFLGPLLHNSIGVPGLFLLSALFAILAIFLLYKYVPNADNVFHDDAEALPSLLRSTLNHRGLFNLNVGIFILHMVLTATFIALPLMLTTQLHFSERHHWWLYLSTVLSALLVVMPLLLFSEKKHHVKATFIFAVFLLLLSELIFLMANNMVVLALGLWIFFTAFTLLEAMLPSLASRLAPPHAKGTAMGIYSTAQFAGIFAGGSLGGVILAHYHIHGILVYCALAAAVWGIVAFAMPSPPRYAAQRGSNVTI